MHKIISTTGFPIEFKLTSEKNFVIDPVTPIEVTAEELISLLERLGTQISEVTEESTPSTESTPEVEPESTGEVTVTEPESTPKVEPEV